MIGTGRGLRSIRHVCYSNHMTQTSTAAALTTFNAARNAAEVRWARQRNAAAAIAAGGGMASLSRGDLIRIARSLGAVPQVRTSDAMLRTYIEWAMA
jgi:hypothetical protein